MKKHNTIFILMLSILIILSCVEKKEDKTLQAVTIAWRVPIFSTTNQKMLIDVSTAYITETNRNGISAIDLESGKLIWRRSDVINKPITNIVNSNDRLFIHPYTLTGQDTLLLSFFKNGNYDSMTMQGQEETAPRYFSHSAYRNKIYWGTQKSLNGKKLAEFDPVAKTTAYYYETDDEILSTIVFDENRCYFAHFPKESAPNNDLKTTLVCLDIDNNFETLWSVTLEQAKWVRGDSIFIKDNYVYIAEYWETACFDKYTGKKIWSNSNIKGTSSGGMSFYKDKIYYISPLNNEDNLFCLEAKTGKVIWSALASDTTCETRPIVYKDYVYCATQDNLVVFNAETGKEILRDRSIKSGLVFSPTEQYKDLMIIQSALGELIAVKMDIHTY